MKGVLLFLLSAFNLSYSQSLVFKPFQLTDTKGISENLKVFDVFQFDVKDFVRCIDSIPGNVKEISFKLQNKNWQFILFEYSLTDANWIRNTGGQEHVKRLSSRKDFRTFNGYIKNLNSMVSLSIGANGFFKMMIDDRTDRYFIEPLESEYQSKDIPNNQQFVYYKSSDVISNGELKCGADLVNHEISKRQNEMQAIAATPCRKCVIVKIALAADFTMYKRYSRDVVQTENQMLSTLADVQTVFDDEFTYEYEYVVTATYVPEDSLIDPWRTAGSIETQLYYLTMIGPNIFWGATYNVATMWTTKWTTGTTGVATQSSICNIYGYNVCSEFAGRGKQGIYLTLQAHMLGHNWSMIHDPALSPTIMNPVISGSTRWSALSKQMLDGWVINNKLIENGCLSECPGTQAPEPGFDADIRYGCQPVTVRFMDLSKNTTSWKWSFPGGSPSVSTLQNPVIVYSTVGKYEVFLEAANSRCAVSITKPEFIEINDVPIPDFNFGININREVYFSNYSQRGIEYLWKFGDGEESEEIDPVHFYPRDTTYEVTLIVTNDCGTRTIKKKINVISQPVADFVADTTTGCAPKIIKFINKSSNNVIKWLWNFPGGNPTFSNAENPFVRYDFPGVYNVQLTVFSLKSSHTLTRKLYITIDSLPDAEFDYQINGNTISFESKSRYSKSHYWIFGDNAFSTDSNPSHNYLEGRYEVLYIATNTCGDDTAKTLITVGAKPIAGFQVNDYQGCLPFQVQFTNTSTVAATAFRWYFPGGNPSMSTDKNPLITYNAVGKFNVSLFAYNNFFDDSIGLSDFIEVLSAPTSNFTNTISGFKSFFTHQATGATNYFWDFGDSHFSFEENPNYDYGVEGEFDVRLIVQNECELDTFSKHIAVYLVPKVNFNVDTIRGCAPLKVKFTDKSSIDVTEWDWQFENGNPATSNEKNPVVEFTKKGKFSVKLSVKNTNGSNQLTRTQYIQVLSPVLCPEQTKTKRFIISEDPFGVNIENRAKELDLELPLIYPNPAQDYIHVITDASIANPVFVEIFDLSGRKHFNKAIIESELRISTDHFRAGTYYIKIKDGIKSDICKFVIAE